MWKWILSILWKGLPSYYQGNQTVDDYLDSFLILTSDARYIDPWTLVVKFR